MSEYIKQTDSDINMDKWSPMPDTVYSPDGTAFSTQEVAEAYGPSEYTDYVTAPDGYGLIPAEVASQESEYSTPLSPVDRFRNTANATIILGTAAAIATEKILPGTIANGVEIAQQVYEQAPTPAVFALGSAAVAVAFSWQTFKNIREIRQEKNAKQSQSVYDFA